MASRKKGKGVKLVALIIVALMVVAFLTTGIYALLGTSGNGVSGTWKLADGSKLVLDENGRATITIPGSNQTASTTYEVDGDKVTLLDPSTGKDLITFTHKGNTLTATEGTSTEVWTRQ